MIHWDRYIAIIGRITQRPEVWKQNIPRLVNGCGCVGAHAMNDSGLDGSIYSLSAWVGFNDVQTMYVYSSTRTLAELQELAITQKFPWERAR